MRSAGYNNLKRLHLPIDPRGLGGGGGGYTVNVGAGETYTTIEAAAAAITGMAPDAADPVYMRLVDASYTLSDAQVVMPAYSGIIGAGAKPSDHTVNGLADRSGSVIDNQMFLVNSGNIYENFYAVANNGTGNAGQFASPAGLTGDVSFRSIDTDEDHIDAFYLFGGGDYHFQGCNIGTDFDGIAVFGSDASQNITLSSCNLFSTKGVTAPVNLMKVTNSNASVVINDSLIQLTPAAEIGNIMTGVRVQALTTAPDLEINRTSFKSVGAATHGFAEMHCLNTNLCNLDVNDVQFNMVNTLDLVPGSLQDYAVVCRDTVDLTSGFNSNCQIYEDSATLTVATVQDDISGNTVSGFPIT